MFLFLLLFVNFHDLILHTIVVLIQILSIAIYKEEVVGIVVLF